MQMNLVNNTKCHCDREALCQERNDHPKHVFDILPKRFISDSTKTRSETKNELITLLQFLYLKMSAKGF
ncbi:CLUMA_CG019900, isoform A [Clunio marinus]|uniref:CLUMA_CG019900, isoform A n=1 Tax=Clunio marinus TaxID=568069 RepID=A0A1J1J3W3_9DIPT|nr:CLUMA_CG019900, isoform A [Clunio marinus]